MRSDFRSLCVTHWLHEETSRSKRRAASWQATNVSPRRRSGHSLWVKLRPPPLGKITSRPTSAEQHAGDLLLARPEIVVACCDRPRVRRDRRPQFGVFQEG